MKQVFIVDEEAVFSRAIEGIVRFKGHKPILFKDASSAVDEISAAISEHRDAVYLIDVTLAGGSNTSMFSSGTTDGFAITGLVLVEEIFGKTGPNQADRSRVILYTANHLSTNWDRIRSFAIEQGCRYWKKDVNANIDEIIDMIEAK